MSKKLTTEEWKAKASEKHNGFYDYSLSSYVTSNVKVVILCPIHGEFTQKPGAHANRGDRCPKCGLESRAKINRTTKEDFINVSNQVHNFKFDYSLVEYFKRLDEHTTIICPKHGEYRQNIGSHMRGSDCEKCSYEKRGSDYSISKKELLKRLSVFNNRLTYDLSEYTNINSFIKYTCETHGEIKQKAQKHLRKGMCSKCAKKGSWNTGNTEKFIERAKSVHGNRYDYSEVNYITNRKKVKIICGHHGSFLQSPNTHVEGYGGCPICAKIMSSYRKDLTNGEIESSKNINCFLYVLEFSTKNEQFWKIGISSNFHKRKNDLSKQREYNISEVYVSKGNVFDCINLEQNIIQKYKEFKHKPIHYFQGHTECFSVNPIENFEELKSLQLKVK